MGRKTYDSLPGKLLNRKIFVLTNNTNLQTNYEDVFIINNIEDIINKYYQNPCNDIYICGGKSVYELFIPFYDKLIISTIKNKFKGNVYFPSIPYKDFNIINQVDKDEFLITY